MTITATYLHEMANVFSSKSVCYEAANMMVRSSGPFSDALHYWFSLCQ